MDRDEVTVRNIDRVVKHFDQLLAITHEFIETGDYALREHIGQQTAAIREALVLADALERERVANVEKLMEAKAVGALEAIRVMTETLQQALATHEEASGLRFDRIERQMDTFVRADVYENRHQQLEMRWTELDRWRSNVSGRYIGLAAIGAVAIAVASALVTHLVS